MVLAGEMVVDVDGEDHCVGEGDVLFLPAGAAHGYENRGDVPVRFLCIVPATAEYGTDWLEELDDA